LWIAIKDQSNKFRVSVIRLCAIGVPGSGQKW
jgi:hypothetical protein